MDLQVFFLAIASLAGAVISLLVISRNWRSNSNKAYLLLSLSIIVWMNTSYLTDHAWSDGAKLVFAKLAFFFGVAIIASLYIFSWYFPIRSLPSKTKRYIFTLAVTLVGLLTVATNTVVQAIIPRKDITDITPGVLYYGYILVFAVLLIVSIARLRYAYKNYTGKEKSQVQFVIFGVGFGFSWGLITNAVLPGILPQWGTVRLGPLASIIVISFIAMSIIRHKLFDIGSFVFRAVVYLLATTGIVALYTAVVFGVGSTFLPTDNITVIQKIFFAMLAVVIALTYGPIIHFFNTLTSKLFFRDAYNSQGVLDQVSNVIVGNIDPHKVQKGALAALNEALKPTYIVFLFLNRAGKLQKGNILGHQWGTHNPDKLEASLKSIGRRLTIYDELEEEEVLLRETLKTEDISLAAPLVTKDEIVGYLILGQKKSGNIYTSQDVSLLKLATNELAVALQNAQRFEEIQAFNITLQEKVTEATRELKQTNKKLIALDEAKDEFISMASHQLRTPLTSIKGYISMLLEGDLGKLSEPQQKALKEAFGSSQRMVYLIADFLNVSRIKTGKFMIETKEVDLPEIVREELTQLREMAGSRDLKLIYEQPEVFPRVKLDDNKIRQVMMNMVDNAIYYTPSGGKITIQLYSTGDEIIFKVIDSGIGVPKSEQHKLFTKFYRAGNARKSRPDGTGLGLFMAQKIIVEQGGAIIFESTEGKGSTFGWRFPIAKIKV